MATPLSESDSGPVANRRSNRVWRRFLLLVRRVHLYAGLFLLPWVYLYGVTGAMFNHQQLFPEATFTPVSADHPAFSRIQDFPSPEELARQVAAELQSATGANEITLADAHHAAFTNSMQFEARHQDGRHLITIDSVSMSAVVAVYPPQRESPEDLLPDINSIRLSPNPHDLALSCAREILSDAPAVRPEQVKPLGWTKLNFIAYVDGVPARITYVLKDGHVDVERYDADDGFSLRQYFLGLHTSHGHPPHWNTRSLWSLVIDLMAIAMVTWGTSGVLMWWQIKRTRLLGGLVIAASLTVATLFFYGMSDYYAMTRL